MTKFHNFSTHLFIRRQPANRTDTPSLLAADSAGSSATAEQIVQDKVALSRSGQKIINLARGQKLATDSQAILVSKNTATTLLTALEKISRTIRRLTETTKSGSLEWRRYGP